jgi:hypothetical protein
MLMNEFEGKNINFKDFQWRNRKKWGLNLIGKKN